MKTQVLQLEIHDDVISILDRIKWGQTPRILLVWPPSRQPNLSKIDLLRIQRQSDQLGGQIALVTNNPNSKQYAVELGIPTFRTVRKAQSTSWARTLQYHRLIQKKIHSRQREQIDYRQEQSKVRPAPSKFAHKFWFRLVTFTIGVLAFISIGLVLLPNATIHLEPETQTQDQVFEVYASIDVTQINISGIVPIYQENIILESRGSIPSTGEIQIPDRFARGEVILMNLTNEPVILPQGSVVTTLDDTPLRFLTLTDAHLSGQLNYSTTVQIQAINPGIDYNTPELTIAAIEGPQGLNLQVSNPAPVFGGSYTLTRSPTKEDQTNLYNQTLQDLQKTALEEITSRISEEDILLSKALDVVEVHEETYSPGIDDPSDVLSLILRIEFSSYIVQAADIDLLGREILQANLQPDSQVIEDTYSFHNLTSPIFRDQSEATWEVVASWDTIPVIDEERLAEAVRGKETGIAADIVTTIYSLSSPPVIQLAPDWWPLMPFVPFSIHIAYE